MEEQRVILENRNKMTVSQVVDVDAFDEGDLYGQILRTARWEVSGSGLHIEKLDLAEGVLVVTGSISSFAYIEGKKQRAANASKPWRADCAMTELIKAQLTIVCVMGGGGLAAGLV